MQHLCTGVTVLPLLVWVKTDKPFKLFESNMQTNNSNINDVSTVANIPTGNQKLIGPVPLLNEGFKNKSQNITVVHQKNIILNKKKNKNKELSDLSITRIVRDLPRFSFRENFSQKCVGPCDSCIGFPTRIPCIYHTDFERDVVNITTPLFHERRSTLPAMLIFDVTLLYPNNCKLMNSFATFKELNNLNSVTRSLLDYLVMKHIPHSDPVKYVYDTIGKNAFVDNVIFLFFLYTQDLFFCPFWLDNDKMNFGQFLSSLELDNEYSLFSHLSCAQYLFSASDLYDIKLMRRSANIQTDPQCDHVSQHFSFGKCADIVSFIRFFHSNFSMDVTACITYAHLFHKNLDLYLFPDNRHIPTSLFRGFDDHLYNLASSILIPHTNKISPTCFIRCKKCVDMKNMCTMCESKFFSPQNGNLDLQGLFSVDHNVTIDPQSTGDMSEMLKSILSNLKINHGFKFGDFEFDANCGLSRLFVSTFLLILPDIVSIVFSQDAGDIAECVCAFVIGYRAFEPNSVLHDKIIFFVNMVKGVLKATKHKYDRDFIFVPQGVDLNPGWADCLVVPFCSLLYYFFFKKDMSFGLSHQIKDFIVTIPRLKGGVESLISWLLNVAQRFLSWLTERFGFKRFSFTFVDPALTDLQARFDEFHSKMRAGEPYNYDNGMILYDIERDVRKYKDSLPLIKSNEQLRNGLNELLKTLSPFVSKFERNNIIGNGPRVEPLGIMLGGPTAVGKSTATVPLIIAVCSQVLSGDKLKSFVSNHNDHVWNYISENHFHDSYHGQFNTIVDEVGGLKDSVGTPDPASLFCLRMINVANLPLTMAHLDDKGNVNFRSELIWATTNRNFFDWNAMYMPKAFTRRFEVSMLTVPKSEYSLPLSQSDSSLCLDEQLWKRQIDKSKLSGDEVIDLDMYEFYPWDYANGKSIGAPISFDQLVSLICDKYRAKKNKGELVLDYHQKLKAKYMAKRDDMVTIENIVPPKCNINENKGGMDIGTIYTSCVDALSKAYNAFSDNFMISEWPETLLSASAITLAAYGIWRLLEPRIFPQSGQIRHAKGNRKFTSRNRNARFVKFKQAGVTQNIVDVAESIVRKNMYTIGVLDGPKFGYVLFIKDKVAIFPEHFVHALDNKYGEDKVNDMVLYIQKTNSNTRYEFRFGDLELHTSDMAEDCLFAVFPSFVHPHTNITKYFAPADNSLVKDKFYGGLLKLGDYGYGLVASDIIPHGSKAYGSFHLEKGYMYNIGTQNGDCGAPVFLCDKRSPVPYIVGFHLYGSGSGVGGCNVLCKESIEDMVNYLEFGDKLLDDELSDEQIQAFAPQCSLDNRFVALRTIEKHRVPIESRILRTDLSDIFGPPLEAPALLRKEGDIDPWKIARSKYNCVQKYIDQDVLHSLSMELIHEIFHVSSHNDPHKPRIFSFEEAVSGIHYLDYWDSIPRDTSPGYPWNLLSKLPGKIAYFGKEGDYEFSSDLCQQLRNRVNSDLKIAAQGKRLDVVFTDHLKDERRPLEKVKIGKTRLFSASPLHYTIMVRMYFGDFLRWLFENRIKNGFAPGINPYSDEWKFLVDHLRSVGNNMIPGDFSAYDGSLMNIAMLEFLNAAETFYYNSTPEDTLIRRVLFWEVLNSKHLSPTDKFGGIIYEWVGSNSSGNPMTTAINTFCGLLLVRYAIVLICVKRNGYTLSGCVSASWFRALLGDIRDHLRQVSFGDDLIPSVGDPLIWVNQETLTEAFAQIGMKFTDAAKSGEIFLHKPITQCTFLKRGFVYSDRLGKWRAPLDIDVIKQMNYWTRKNVPVGELQQTFEQSLMELSIHGKEVFDELAPVLVKEVNKHYGLGLIADFRIYENRSLVHQGFY